jgi:lysine 2,3-aminomutase
MLPTYVLDLPGGHGKVPLESRAVRPGPGEGRWSIEDGAGKMHVYPPEQR